MAQTSWKSLSGQQTALVRKAKSRIKQTFPRLVQLYRSCGRIFRTHGSHELWAELLDQLDTATSEVFFVQIGAMDGRSFDPIHEFVRKNHWRGLLVEPLPDLFEELKGAYRGYDGLIFENVAIAEAPGNRQMYRVAPGAVRDGSVPDWAKGVASFFDDRNALGGRGVSEEAFQRIRPHILTQTVVCDTLGNLLQKHEVTRIDVFQVDVEGYDYEVLKQLGFKDFKPLIIRIEWCNLPDKEKDLSIELLRRHGYRTRLVSDDLDLLAWRELGILVAMMRRGKKRKATQLPREE